MTCWSTVEGPLGQERTRSSIEPTPCRSASPAMAVTRRPRVGGLRLPSSTRAAETARPLRRHTEVRIRIGDHTAGRHTTRFNKRGWLRCLVLRGDHRRWKGTRRADGEEVVVDAGPGDNIRKSLVQQWRVAGNGVRTPTVQIDRDGQTGLADALLSHGDLGWVDNATRAAEHRAIAQDCQIVAPAAGLNARRRRGNTDGIVTGSSGRNRRSVGGRTCPLRYKRYSEWLAIDLSAS